MGTSALAEPPVVWRHSLDPALPAKPPQAEDPRERAQLAAFCRALASSPALQHALQGCTTPDAIVALAAAQGFVFSRTLLRTYAMELSAPWWPWAETGVDGRRMFFL